MTGYGHHTPWSDPGPHKLRLRELPGDPDALPDALENFVIHHAVARAIGYGVPVQAEPDRNLRTAARLVAAVVERDARPLGEHRDLKDYLYGSCHDFALLAVAALRERGVPARLRVGCAGYFAPGRWEDHWICEHRAGDRWAVLDAQLGPRARAGFRVGFPVADVPPTAWKPAAEVWRAIRAGTIDDRVCGVRFAGIEGRWFIASAVMRDAAVLAGIECLPWDYWGPARRFLETGALTGGEADDIDALAEALDPAPATQEEAMAVLERFPWARPTDTVVSVIRTTPTEAALLPKGP